MEAPEAIQTSKRSMAQLEAAERNSRLWFIADACDALVEFSTGKTLDDLRTNELLRSAMELQLIRAGNATRRLTLHHPETASKLPTTPELLTMPERLAYGQPHVDDATLWNVITTEVPPLLAEVRALLPSG